MVIRSKENLVGAWAFLIGLIIALVTGFFSFMFETAAVDPFILLVLVILGILVGYFVAEKDVQTFLFASVSLVIVSYMGIQGVLVGTALKGIHLTELISSMFISLLSLFVPSTIVVALKTVFSISKS
jgi:hypothetical protein